MKHKVRTVTINGSNEWFVLADVCAAMDVGNTSQAASRLDEEERGIILTDTPGGRQKVIVVNESGLWSTVMTSRKPEAKAFKKWLTSTVIPSIRKTGSYVVGEDQIATAKTPEDLMAVQDAIQSLLERKASMLEDVIAKQQEIIAVQSPKAEVFDAHVAPMKNTLCTSLGGTWTD